MIDINKTYRTRDGHEVRIYATDGQRAWPVHGAILLKNGWSSECWNNKGSSLTDMPCGTDLIEVPPRHKRTVWVNVYKDDWDAYTAASKEDADENASEDRIACIKVELDFEEGDGL